MFKKGDVVRLKSNNTLMTVVSRKVEDGKEQVFCTYLDSDKKKQEMLTTPETLIKVKKGSRIISEATKRITYGISGFIMGFAGLSGAIYITGNQIVHMENYISVYDVENNYTEKSKYNSIEKENESLKLAINEMRQSSNKVLIDKVESLESIEAELYKKLPGIIAKTSSLSINLLDNHDNERKISYQEEIEREKIEKVGERIEILLNKIKYYEDL